MSLATDKLKPGKGFENEIVDYESQDEGTNDPSSMQQAASVRPHGSLGGLSNKSAILLGMGADKHVNQHIALEKSKMLVDISKETRMKGSLYSVNARALEGMGSGDTSIHSYRRSKSPISNPNKLVGSSFV